MKLRYWNLLGVPTAFFWDRCLGRPHRDAALSHDRPDHWWDSTADFWFRTVENRFAFPAGVSLVAVATPLIETVPSTAEARQAALSGRRTREAYEPMANAR